MILLSILIPTIPERKVQFSAFHFKIINQIHAEGARDKVEFCVFNSPKGAHSVGEKRDALYRMATGTYSVQLDDDDDVPDDFIKEVLKAIEQDADCIGYYERCVMDGTYKRSKISIDCKCWQEFNEPINGNHYERTPFFKTPIKTELCQKVGVKDMRFAEDHDFAIRIYPYLKTETFIAKEMYYYSANTLTPQQHKERYGITN